MATTTLWEEIVDALEAVNGGPHPGYRAVHAKGTICRGPSPPRPRRTRLSRAAHLQGDPVEATVRFSNASGHPRTPDADPLAGRGMAVKFHLPGRRGHRHRLGAARRLPRAHARGLPGDDPRPDPGPGDRPAGSGEARRLPRRASRDRRRAPEGPAQARPDHQLRHLRLPRAPRLLPGRRRRRNALGPLHLGAGGGARVPDRRAARGRADATTCRRRSGSGSPTASRGSRSSSPSPTTATRSTTRPSNGRASTRWSSSASSRCSEVVEDAETPDNPLVFDPMRLTDGIEPSDDRSSPRGRRPTAVSIERRTASRVTPVSPRS